MADSYTASLRLQLQQTGNNSGTWGTIENTQLQLIENAITGDNSYAGGSGGISIAGLTTYTLTVAQGTTDQARQQLYPFVGALTGNCTVTIPGVVKMGWVLNATTGGYSVILKVGAGGTLTVPAGGWQFFYCDGVNVTSPTFLFSALTVGGYSVVTNNSGTYNISITGNATTATTAAVATAATTATTALSANSVPWSGITSIPYTFNQSVGTGNNVTFNSVTVTNGLTCNTFQAATSGIINTLSASTITCTGANSYGGTGCYIDYSGSATTPSSWSASIGAVYSYSVQAQGFFTTSDRRLKTRVVDIAPEEGERWVRLGRPRHYWKEGRPEAGFIAQEDIEAGRGEAIVQVTDAAPLFAEGDGFAKPGHRLARNYENDIAYLTAALQSALSRIEALERG